MERCKATEPMHERLTDLHYGLLDAADERATRLHLDQCEVCACELAAMAQLTGALRGDEAFPDESRVDWDAFARATVRRAMEPEPSFITSSSFISSWAERLRRLMPSHMESDSSFITSWAERLRHLMPSPMPAWAGAAAGLVLLVGTSLVAGRFMGGGVAPLSPDAAVDGGAMASVYVPETNIDNITVNLARQNTAEYLRQTRAVLVSMLDVNIDCDKGRVDVSAERAKATELLRRQRLIATELHRMPLARAQDVCNDLEKLLLEVASLTDCTRSDEIQTLRDLVEKKQILMRMELLGQELAREGGARA